MKRLYISDEKKAALREHLSIGTLLQVGDLHGKQAWMRKACVHLLMLDPEVEAATTGLLRRAYTDLSSDLTAIETESDPIDFSYRVEQRFRSALSTVDALAECISVAPDAITGGGEPLNPYFFGLPDRADDHVVFVLMPFTEPWSSRIWQDHIKPIVQGLEVSPRFVCRRADDLYGHDVLLDIVGAIKTAAVVIADTTGRNPNVFYELGIAHTYGQPVVLLTQRAEDIPFDLQRFRHIVYEDNSDGYRALERGLKGALLEIAR